MGCVGVRRGLYFFFNIKVNNEFRIDGIIFIRGGVREEEGFLFYLYLSIV